MWLGRQTKEASKERKHFSKYLTTSFGFKKRFPAFALLKIDDLVAQLVEHYTFNVGVLGSNPSQITC